MGNRFLLLFLFMLYLIKLSGDDNCFRIEGQGDPSTYIHGCVNAISGSFIFSSQDLAVDGPEPLSFIRHYCSSNRGDRNFGVGFGHNHATKTTPIRGESDSIYKSIQIEDSGGDLLFFTAINLKRNLNFYLDPIQLRRGYTNSARGHLSGRTNIKNTTIEVIERDKEREIGRCEVFLGDGTRRKYDKNCLLTHEYRPSGNLIRYTYDREDRIKKIESTDLSGITKLGWLEFSYNNNSVRVAASNGKVGAYELDKSKGSKKSLLSNCTLNGVQENRFEYMTNDSGRRVLKKILKANGDFLSLNYWNDKVQSIYLPDANGKASKVYDICYHPHSKYTEVKNSCDGKTIYRYSKKLRLTRKERYHDGNLYSSQKFYWGGYHRNGEPGKRLKDDEGNLLTQGVVNAQNEMLSATAYSYDGNGNVLKETLIGNLSGSGDETPIQVYDKWAKLEGHETYSRNYTYSQDGFNLVTSITEQDGSSVSFKYFPNTDKVVRKLNIAGGKIVSREFYEYNHLFIMTKKIADDGTAESVNSLQGVTQRSIVEIKPNLISGSYGFGKPLSVIESYLDPHSGEVKRLKRMEYTYGAFDLVTSMSLFDAEDQFRYTLTFQYDACGNCIEATDPLGRITHYRYDEANQCIFKELVGSGLSTVYEYDCRGRLTKTIENHASGETFVKETLFDDLDRKIAEMDPFGNKTSFDYDDMGRLIKITHPSFRGEGGNLCAPVELREYNIWDQVICETDAGGFSTRKKYTIRGQISEIEYPDGTFESFRYNLNGTLRKKVNKNKSYLLYSYDARNRVIREESCSPEGEPLRSKVYQYEGNNLVFETDALGNVTEYLYDGAGRKIAKVQHGTDFNFREEYQYDPLGRVAITRKWYGQGDLEFTQTVKDYDLLGRVTQECVEDASGKIFSKISFSYDINGNCTEQITYLTAEQTSISKTDYTSYNLPLVSTDPLGYETHHFYDFNYKNELGQTVLKTLVVDPLGIKTTTIKDTHGRDELVEKRSGEDNLLSSGKYRYDQRGLKISHTACVLAEGSKIREYEVRWSYDPLGRELEIVEDPQGIQKRTSMTYHALGGLKTKTRPDGISIIYDYDALGRETSIASSDGSVSYAYTYDLNDRLIESDDRLKGMNINRTYDCFGNLIVEEFSNDCRLAFRYDCQRRLTAMTLPDSSLIAYEYDPISLLSVRKITSQGGELYKHCYVEKNYEGRTLRSALITGDEVNFAWDPMGRPVSITTRFASGKVPSGGYDAAGNLLEIEYSGVWGGQLEQYAYDALNHLNSESCVREHQYLSDSLDNVIQKDTSPFALNALNQVEDDGTASYEYDLNGNLIKEAKGEGVFNYAYDALNRLISTTKEGSWRVEYRYDSFGRCLERKKFHWASEWVQDEERHFFFLGHHEIGSISEDGNIHELCVIGQGEGSGFRPAVAIELAGQIFAPIYDHRFNVIALVDFNTQTLKEAYRYSAYGEVVIYGENGELLEFSRSGNPWLFSGKRYDFQTDLYNFGKRYYRPSLGRWTTPDPGGFVDGWNLYAYTHNRPLIFADFYGYQTTPAYPVYGGLSHGNIHDEWLSSLGYILETFSHHCLPASNPQYCWEGIGRMMQNQPFSHQYAGDLGFYSGVAGDLPTGNMRFRYIPGINTSKETAHQDALMISEMFGGLQVHYTCHESKGFVTDLIEAFKGYLGLSYPTQLNEVLVSDYYDMKGKCGNNFHLNYLPHSRGGLDFYLASEDLSKTIKNKMSVYTLGSAKMISQGDFSEVVNYVNPMDIVPTLGVLGTAALTPFISSYEEFFDKPQVVYTGYSSNSIMSPIDDHLINCPGYKSTLEAIYPMIKNR